MFSVQCIPVPVHAVQKPCQLLVGAYLYRAAPAVLLMHTNRLQSCKDTLDYSSVYKLHVDLSVQAWVRLHCFVITKYL